MTPNNLRKSLLLSLLLMFGLAMTVTVDAQSKKDIKKSNQLVEQGNREFGKKNYRGAVDNYAQAVTLNPKNATAHFWKGYAHY
jgi:Flp pilus assembly protein TadD